MRNITYPYTCTSRLLIISTVIKISRLSKCYTTNPISWKIGAQKSYKCLP